MNVIDMFHRIGVPIPYGAEVYCNGLVKDTWDWSYWDGEGDRLNYTLTEGEGNWYWLADDKEPTAGSLSQINIAELPAGFAAHALPTPLLLLWKERKNNATD